MVNNAFAYGPNDKFFFMAINFLASWTNGSLTAHFFSHLKSKIGSFKICVDQGFPQSGDATKWAARHLHRDICNYLLWISNVYKLLHQASEWGMHGLQGTFPCCKKRLPSNLVQRHLVLEAIVLVHNFQMEHVGGNQIKMVFDPKYVCVQNLCGYNQTAQYYFRPREYDSEEDRSGTSKSDGK
jgi:hypothetical protein